MNKDLELLGNRRVAIEQLIQSEGWKLFEAMMQEAKATAERQMIETSNAHDAAKYVGAFHALKSVLSWPERELHAIKIEASMLKERK